MKRISAIILSLCLLLVVCIGLLPSEVSAATSGKYTYSVSNGRATITSVDTSISGSITIPSKLGGYPVTEIGDSAFWCCEYLTGVVIPNSVTSIGSSAFSYCGKLTNVTIPNSVTSIGTYAFRGCNITSITIPDSVTSVGNYAFKSCINMTTAIIGNGVTSIGDGTFSYCSKISSVTIPAGISKIGGEVFAYCSNLTNIYYEGTEKQWTSISIGSNNDNLNNAQVYCAVTIDSSLYPESAHNYANNLSESKSFSWPRAKKLVITFSSSTFTETNYDYIYLYDGSGKQIAKYTGSAAAGVSVEVPGDSFSIKLTSNSSTQKYGYSFDSIAAYMPKHNNHPICGASCACSNDAHSSQTWEAWDGTTKLYNGYYYLTQDIVLSSTMVLDYSYVSYLCLNGYSITCEDTVFSIYSYRSLVITDCIETGKIETTGNAATIKNNKFLRIWNGSIINSGDGSAIHAYANTNTYVCGGRVGGNTGEAIYIYPGAKVNIQGGLVHSNEYCAIGGHNNSSGTLANLTISGGRIYTNNPQYYAAVELQNGNFTMTGGCIDTGIYIYDPDGITTISGGVINEHLNSDSGSISISGGTISSPWFCGDTAITAGTFQGSCYFSGSSHTVSGGDFSSCEVLVISGKTWICGGYFNLIRVDEASLYLSGVPKIETIILGGDSMVSAQNPDNTGSYGGDIIELSLNHPYNSTDKENGDIIVNNVTSAAVAQKFILLEANESIYMEHSGNNLLLRILPQGTWGDNINWMLKNGVLTISGTGAIKEANSGYVYPWGSYLDQITAIVVEKGITQIPSYTFEYLESATTISLPDTLTTLALNAFNDCGKLNNLMLPASITTITGSSNTGYPAFIRCESLTDVYYMGTEAQWLSIPKATYVQNTYAQMQMHFLTLHETPPTCTQPGKQTYYAFDDTSIYSYMFDMDWNPITTLSIIAATGHRYGEYEITLQPTFTANGQKQKICSLCGDIQTEALEPLVGNVVQWNIVLEDDYAINFYLQVSESIESTAKVRLTNGNDTVTYNVSALDKNEDGYFKLTANISAAQMNDFITVMVMNGRDIGSNAIYTAREYCDKILANDAYSQYHTLVKEMLDYGAMAQIYFDYNADNLANDGITGVATQDVPETAEELTVSDKISELSFYGASLVYRDRIAVRYYFTGDVTGCTFTANGNTYTPVAKDDMYYIEIADILPQNLDQQITLTVKDADGNTLSVAYGPMNYIVRMNQKGSDNLKALAKALYNYHLAAKSYSAAA